MKRFTLFLSLMLSCFSIGLNAQSFTASDAPGTDWAENTKWYIVKLANGNYLSLGSGYVDDSGNLKANNTTQPSKTDETALWCLVGNETDGYQFYNKSAGVSKVLGVTGSEGEARAKMYDASTTDASVYLTFKRATSQLAGGKHDCFRVASSDNNYFNSRGGYLALWNSNQAVNGWTGSGGDEGSGFYFMSTDLISVTYEYYIDGALYKSIVVEQEPGTTPAAPAQDYITNFSYEVTSVGTSDCTVRVNCSETLPFIVTTDLNNAKWYAWRMHSNYPKFLSYSTAENKVVFAEVATDNYTILSDDANFWCITGNLVDGFKLYNKTVGTTQSLSYASGDPVMSEADASNTWKLVKSSANSDWFCLKRADGSSYMNLDLGSSPKLTYYGNPDAGSSIYLHTPASFPVNYVAGYINAPANAVGSSNYLNENEAIKTDAIAKLATAQDDEFDFTAAQELAEVANNVATGSFVAMAPGYYRIYNAQPGLYANNRGLIYAGSVTWGEVSKSNVNNIVKLETGTNTGDEGKYYLYACNAKKYMQGVLGALGNTAGTNSGITLTELGGAQYNLVFGNGTMHAEGHNGGSGLSGNVINWSGGANSASAWYLIPATDLEVALNTVGEASYASAYLPFPVQGSGIYTGAINAEKTAIEMTEQTGVLPAETGIVIKGAKDATSTTLTIGGTVSADVTGNSLTGTLTALTANLSNYLVLGKGNTSNGIGFFAPSSSLSTIAANKAFILASDVTGTSPAIAMNFGGETTGVGTVITEEGIESNAPVFDLSGRRVMQTVKGGLYIQNGKKFIVK